MPSSLSISRDAANQGLDSQPERMGGISSPVGVGAGVGVVPAAAHVGWRDARVGGWPHLPPGITQLGLDPLAWGKRGYL